MQQRSDQFPLSGQVKWHRTSQLRPRQARDQSQREIQSLGIKKKEKFLFKNQNKLIHYPQMFPDWNLTGMKENKTFKFGNWQTDNVAKNMDCKQDCGRM